MKKITAVILIIALLSGFAVTASADIIPVYSLEHRPVVIPVSKDGVHDVNDPDKVLPYGRYYNYDYYKDDNGDIIVKIIVEKYEYPENATTGGPESVKTEYSIKIDDLTGEGVDEIKASESEFGFIYAIKDYFRYLGWKLDVYGYRIKRTLRGILYTISGGLIPLH